jgi:hypothetical protein
MVKWLCYVFDTPVGRSEKLVLLSMSAIKLSGIDVNYHIDESFEGRCVPLKFKVELKPTGYTHSRAETYYYKIDKKGDLTPCDVYRNTTLYDEHDNVVLMTEIQLKNIVDHLGKESVTGTDGDEFEAVTIAPPFSYREKLPQKPHFWPILLGNNFVSSRDFWRVFDKKVKDKQGLVGD